MPELNDLIEAAERHRRELEAAGIDPDEAEIAELRALGHRVGKMVSESAGMASLTGQLASVEAMKRVTGELGSLSAVAHLKEQCGASLVLRQSPWLSAAGEMVAAASTSWMTTFADQLDQLHARATAAALAPLVESLNGLAPVGSALDFSHLFPRVNWPWLEEFAERRRVRDAFEAADLIPSPSMTQDLIDRVVAAHEHGAQPDELAAIVLEAYDANDCALLRGLVDQLCVSPDFAQRVPVLRDTLAAHRAGLDAMTTHSLVAMIEGIMVPFIAEVSDSGKWPKHNDIADELKSWPASLAWGVGSEGYGCLITYLKDHLYGTAHWKTEDPATRGRFEVLNRHRLLHGMAVQGTRLNTLRCYLILDVIEALLPAVRGLLKRYGKEDAADAGSADPA